MSNPEADTASPAEAEKRQPRQARLVKASLGCERLGRFDVTIRNVSKTGVGGKAPHMLQIGERMTLFMPGHQPMMGTVRWVADTRFGFETDEPIETVRLRASHGDDLVTADSKVDFQLVPAPKLTTWRPGLSHTPTLPGHYGQKRKT
ncbi:PilZ domain-containing protein [Sphingopyxis indica]|uniref:PilZ domain-containing protein n=1 Tax=Sphingopyxis indica TaxID=436663 RepID=A0A239GVB9_9SPHN|nr:PilZ domain-containing protein [Sphingopyxis indica]SNS73139.1 PilZ domain-containing protein [Sphingopyxis indica]